MGVSRERRTEREMRGQRKKRRARARERGSSHGSWSWIVACGCGIREAEARERALPRGREEVVVAEERTVRYGGRDGSGARKVGRWLRELAAHDGESSSG